MTSRKVLTIAILLVLVGRPVLAATCPAGAQSGDYWSVLRETVDAAGPSPYLIEATLRRWTTGSRPSLEVKLSRDSGPISAADWSGAGYVGAARTTERIVHKTRQRRPNGGIVRDKLGAPIPPDPDFARAGSVPLLINRDTEVADLSVTVPEPKYGWYGESWELVVAVCKPATRELLGYGVVFVTASPYWPSVALAAAAALALWALLALVAWREHARRLQICYVAAFPDEADTWDKDYKRGRRLAWKGVRATHPVFISQDAFGVGSLSRLQVLSASLVIFGAVTYVLLRSGLLPNFSSDVLVLLGVTGGAAALARAAAALPSISGVNRLWLIEKGVIRADSRLPRLRDIFVSDGEVDVTRVQAVAFTALALAALIAYGASDLQSFAIPAQINWLLGMSQGIYLVGKLIPSDRVKQLNDDLDRVRDAERLYRQAAPAAAPDALVTLRAAWANARPGLLDIFEARFDPAPLDGALAPREP